LQVYASRGTGWIIDNRCTNHMMGEKKMFTSYVKNKDSQDMIIFGDGNHGKVKGLGKIAKTTEHSISNVFLVESLGYNLLSVS
jgi:replication-associated recombination protein RarA